MLTGVNRRALALGAALAVSAAAASYGVYRLARVESRGPTRCAAGLSELGPRCCGEGQRLEGARCVGAPSSCPRGFERLADGCAVESRRVRVPGGAFHLTANDWEGAGVVEERLATVPAFDLDLAEVTYARWARCAERGACTQRLGEPGVPVTGLSSDEADGFCNAEHGRLPSGDEWLLAAFGAEGRRFAWGATGLVCRRAAYGLAGGPCGEGGGPDLAGARPDGASPLGLLDLSGNVAELTRRADGHFVARGGSYASEVAAELTTSAQREFDVPAATIGFRCAYDVPAG